VNGKVYIGQTNNVQRRNSEHCCSDKKAGIDAAIRKYGRDKFELTTIEIVDTDEQANQSEMFWINEMRKFLGKKNVYNITDGGDGTRGVGKKGEDHPMFGKHHPENVRAKISKTLMGKMLGVKMSQEACANIAKAKMGDKNPNWGKSPSVETLKKLSIARTGENNGRAILTSEDVVEIRKLLNDGIKRHELAKRFGVSYSNIVDIEKYRSWKKV